MTEENISFDGSLVLIIGELTEIRKFARTGYKKRQIEGLKRAKSMIDKTIEDVKNASS